MSLEIMDYDKDKGWYYRPIKECENPMKPNSKAKMWVDEALDWEKKVYKNEDLCIECKNEFFSKPYDHRDPTPGTIGYCIHCDNCLIKDKEKKMKFDKSRVYTALNADELRSGDKVIVADCLADLKEFVQGKGKIDTLERVLNENANERFVVKGVRYILAYLYERECTCKDCGQICEGKVADDYWKRTCPDWKYNPYLPKTEKSCTKCRMATKLSDGTLACDVDGYPVDCTPPHDEACSDYKPKTEQKEMCLNCKHYNKVNDFRDCTLVDNPTGACPHYETEKHYRPFRDTDELMAKWWKLNGWSKIEAKYKKDKLIMPLIWVREKGCEQSADLITCYGSKGITVRGKGMYFDTLFTMFEFLDGSPCGVEE